MLQSPLGSQAPGTALQEKQTSHHHHQLQEDALQSGPYLQNSQMCRLQHHRRHQQCMGRDQQQPILVRPQGKAVLTSPLLQLCKGQGNSLLRCSSRESSLHKPVPPLCKNHIKLQQRASHQDNKSVKQHHLPLCLRVQTQLQKAALLFRARRLLLSTEQSKVQQLHHHQLQ
jgi:hypothetical protein